MSKKAVVIGAGFGGLSVAALLAKHGYQVHVYEKNSMPGGRAMQIRENGYKFDMGPSWYLMPEAFENYFSLFGKKPSDYYKLKRLDPSYRVFFAAGENYDVGSNLKNTKETFEKIEPGSAKKLDLYLKVSGKRYKRATKKFLYKDYQSWFDIFDLELLSEIIQNGLLKNLDQYISRYFESEKIKKIMSFNTIFLGVSPDKAPALYSMLSYADMKLGVWYPNGGMYSVVKAFEKLCLQNKVSVNYNTPVEKINVSRGKADGITLSDGQFVDADVVVSSADYVFTEKKLLGAKNSNFTKSYWQKKTLAPSAFCIYLGINGNIDKLKHHTLYLGSDWKKNFEEIFEKKVWPKDPSFYICNPSKSDSTIAPKAKENLFILVPVPTGVKDLEKIRSKFYQEIIEKVEEIIEEKITSRIEYKKVITLNDYKFLYNAYEGSAFGLAHTLWQTAIFRPPMKNKKLKNMYYCGQYTHPGVGVPVSIISGQLVAQKIIREI